MNAKPRLNGWASACVYFQNANDNYQQTQIQCIQWLPFNFNPAQWLLVSFNSIYTAKRFISKKIK